MRGGVRIEEGANPKLTANDITPLEEAKVPLPRSLRIRIPLENALMSPRSTICTHFAPSERRSQGSV